MVTAPTAEPRPLRVRHEQAPMPYSCRWCGIPQREHGQRWVPGRGWHVWVEPTRRQIEARLLVRLARRGQRAT